MQFLHSLQDVRTETAQILTRQSGHGHHIDLHRTIFHDDGEITVAIHLRFKCERIFLPFLANLAK